MINSAIAQELKILGVVGPTQSIEKYYQRIKKQSSAVSESSLKKMRNANKSNFSINSFFPIKPKNLTPGRVKNRESIIKGVTSFAVVGTDEFSENWLQVRKQKLIKMGTPIFVVEAENYEQVEKLAKRFKSLKFIPSHGDSIAKNVGVQHYPFLVHSKGVFQ